MNVLHFKNNSQNRDVISLFSGAMGLDIGLAKAGLNIAIGQDFDAACVATMRANGHKVLSGDIRDIDPADPKRYAIPETWYKQSGTSGTPELQSILRGPLLLHSASAQCCATSSFQAANCLAIS